MAEQIEIDEVAHKLKTTDQNSQSTLRRNEKIVHKTMNVNGINMHVAEIGDGPAVLFLHGFPDLWYSWRHQMLHLSSKGFRAIAPDLRGYGDTDPGTSFLVGHDFGAIIAWQLCLFRPDRVKALVNLSVPFMPRHPYLSEPGEIEGVFASAETANIMRRFLSSHDPAPLIFPKEMPLPAILQAPAVAP
ncbi:hypothetical protein Leryth_014665 [Lithospermum erythrorhizon]|nr:hypothetical protein Leryth_014665 [Lithospermum erythrorhizon]